MPYYGTFDIISAHYAYCADYHEGVRCPLYHRMCRLKGEPFGFSPGPTWRGRNSLTDNGKAIYDNLVKKGKS